MDITYLPMRRGARHGLGPVAAHASLSLLAIMDWHTRMVLAWRISNIEPWSATGPRTIARALAEMINGLFLFKAEVIHRRGPWRSFEAVEYATLEWPYGDARIAYRLTGRLVRQPPPA